MFFRYPNPETLNNLEKYLSGLSSFFVPDDENERQIWILQVKIYELKKCFFFICN